MNSWLGLGWGRVSHDVSGVPLRELACLCAQICLHTRSCGTLSIPNSDHTQDDQILIGIDASEIILGL